MRVKLFTHTDLDGVGCAVLARHAFGDDVDISYCNYDDIDAAVTEFIESGAHEGFERVYITDIYVKEGTAELIDKVIRDKVKLLDHHSTAQELNKYQWAHVVEHSNDRKTSGTELFFRELLRSADILFVQNDAGETFVNLVRFVEHVRRYDTWEWVERADQRAKDLNDLMHLIGRDRFVARFSADPNPSFNDTEKLLLELEQERINAYIEQKAAEMRRCKLLDDYKVGVVFAERYISQLGNALALRNPDLDFVAIINLPRAVSYRGIKDIHLGEVAKLFGGGGHPKAAGSPVSSEVIKDVIRAIFKYAEFSGGDQS